MFDVHFVFAAHVPILSHLLDEIVRSFFRSGSFFLVAVVIARLSFDA